MSLALALGMLRDTYPRADFPDRAVMMYRELLKDMDEAEVLAAVTRLCVGSKFLPSVAEIRCEVAEGKLQLPTPEEAWDIACTGGLRNAAPEVKAAAEAVGGRWNILHSGNPTTTRSQFVKDYAARRASAVRVFTGAQLPPAVSALTMGETMAALPATTRIRPRPVMSRLHRRWAGRDLEPPTEEEKADAIDVLREGWMADEPAHDPLYCEAERVFAEADA